MLNQTRIQIVILKFAEIGTYMSLQLGDVLPMPIRGFVPASRWFNLTSALVRFCSFHFVICVQFDLKIRGSLLASR